MTEFIGSPAPLTDEEVGDLVELGDLQELLVLDGKPYYTGDLRHCEGCGLYVLDENELTEEGLCEECQDEADGWAIHMRAELRGYLSNLL